jgi:hypothetical protein
MDRIQIIEKLINYQSQMTKKTDKSQFSTFKITHRFREYGRCHLGFQNQAKYLTLQRQPDGHPMNVAVDSWCLFIICRLFFGNCHFIIGTTPFIHCLPRPPILQSQASFTVHQKATDRKSG